MSASATDTAGLFVRLGLDRGGFRLDVGFDLAAGQVLAVLGPNGSGKSTLLGLLAGLLRPGRGWVRLGERVLSDVDTDRHVPPHRRDIGLLAQDALLFPHLTALANVAFGPRSRGTPRRAADQLARHWLSEVDCLELAHRRPGQLSGGQAQRVALARALAAAPDLLLLDEPLAALDVDAAPALRGLLRRVLHAPENVRTAVLVTHDPLDALVLADQVLVLDAGRVVESGPTRDVLTAPRTAFTARIAGLNLVSGQAAGGGRLRAEDGTVLAGRAGDGLTAGAPAVAVFAPVAAALHTEPPDQHPGAVIAAEVAGLEPYGDLVRVRLAAHPAGPPWAAGMTADLPLTRAADLDPGRPVWLTVPADQVNLYPVHHADTGVDHGRDGARES